MIDSPANLPLNTTKPMISSAHSFVVSSVGIGGTILSTDKTSGLKTDELTFFIFAP